MKFEVLTAVNITHCGLLGCGKAQSDDWLPLCQGKLLHRQCIRLFHPVSSRYSSTRLHSVKFQNSIIVSNPTSYSLWQDDRHISLECNEPSVSKQALSYQWFNNVAERKLQISHHHVANGCTSLLTMALKHKNVTPFRQHTLLYLRHKIPTFHLISSGTHHIQFQSADNVTKERPEAVIMTTCDKIVSGK